MKKTIPLNAMLSSAADCVTVPEIQNRLRMLSLKAANVPPRLYRDASVADQKLRSLLVEQGPNLRLMSEVELTVHTDRIEQLLAHITEASVRRRLGGGANSRLSDKTTAAEDQLYATNLIFLKHAVKKEMISKRLYETATELKRLSSNDPQVCQLKMQGTLLLGRQKQEDACLNALQRTLIAYTQGLAISETASAVHSPDVEITNILDNSLNTYRESVEKTEEIQQEVERAIVEMQESNTDTEASLATLEFDDWMTSNVPQDLQVPEEQKEDIVDDEH